MNCKKHVERTKQLNCSNDSNTRNESIFSLICYELTITVLLKMHIKSALCCSTV